MKNHTQMTAGLLFALLFSSAVAFSQQIQLKDTETGEPIAFATYQYAGRQGHADAEGRINLTGQPGQNLCLSHLNYGQWCLQTDEIQKGGTFYRPSQTRELFPSSVIALRPKKDEIQSHKLEHQDKLAHDAGSLLSADPAIAGIRKSGGYGFDPVLRGFKYDQINVVMNGAQGATAACPNRMDPPTSQVAPNMTDKIEIIKGPYALRYGNGLGATINFVSAPLAFHTENEIYGRASLSYETNLNAARSEAMIGNSGKNHLLELFGSWSKGNDYKAGNGNVIQADFNRASYGGNLGLKLGKTQTLKLSALRNLAKNTDFAALMMDLRNDDTRMYNAEHRILFKGSALKSVQTTAYYSEVNHLMDNLLKNLTPRMMDASTDAFTQNYGFRSEAKMLFGKNALFAGVDHRTEYARGLRTRTFLMGPNMGRSMTDDPWQNSSIRRYSLFSEYQINRDFLRLVFSGRMELNEGASRNISPEFANVTVNQSGFKPIASLSAGGLYNLPKGFTIGLWAARAQRAPGLSERYINFFAIGRDSYELVGDPGLKPEANSQADLTLEYKSKRITVSADVFYSYIQNYISSRIDPELTPRIAMSPGVRRFVNIDKAVKKGFETRIKHSLTAWLSHELAFAYTNAQNVTEDVPLPETAPADLRYSLRLSLIENKLQVATHYRHVWKQDRIDVNYGEIVTPGFDLFSISAGYHILKNVRVRAAANNLLNTTYYEHLSRALGTGQLYAPGRSFEMSVNWQF